GPERDADLRIVFYPLQPQRGEERDQSDCDAHCDRPDNAEEREKIAGARGARRRAEQRAELLFVDVPGLLDDCPQCRVLLCLAARLEPTARDQHARNCNPKGYELHSHLPSKCLVCRGTSTSACRPSR